MIVRDKRNASPIINRISGQGTRGIRPSFRNQSRASVTVYRLVVRIRERQSRENVGMATGKFRVFREARRTVSRSITEQAKRLLPKSDASFSRELPGYHGALWKAPRSSLPTAKSSDVGEKLPGISAPWCFRALPQRRAMSSFRSSRASTRLATG